jgi:hypothetical protein
MPAEGSTAQPRDGVLKSQFDLLIKLRQLRHSDSYRGLRRRQESEH